MTEGWPHAADATRTVQLSRARMRVLSVSVIAGPDAGQVGPALGRQLRVGTSAEAELVLSDRTVSRLHLAVEIDELGHVLLRDLGSKNGVWLFGARVREAELPDGTRVQCGATVLEIRTTEEDVAVERFDADRLGPLLGASPAMQRLFARILRVAATSEPVLVTGESGTGKELVARCIHELGNRKERGFVILDGGAISGSLAEMELFGHTRGAFTGAHGERAGAFERAHGGTLFLDEIGELPIELQPRLLRAVEDRTVQRLGDRERRKVDVRLVAATHRRLATMVNAGTFREDLYHRLSVLELELPPLRAREGDVALLAREMLAGVAPGDPALAHTLDEALARRAHYPWPGNVRELRNFVTRLAVMGEAPEAPAAAPIAEPDLRVQVDLGFHEAKQRLLETFERRYLEHLLDETGGNLSEAARRAGLSRGYLNEVVAKLGLRRR
jgi:two-component system nitrogen regulation response regulator GlnG